MDNTLRAHVLNDVGHIGVEHVQSRRSTGVTNSRAPQVYRGAGWEVDLVGKAEPLTIRIMQ